MVTSKHGRVARLFGIALCAAFAVGCNVEASPKGDEPDGGQGGGEVLDEGPSATDWVAAGGVGKSASYTMVFTVGQATTNQGKPASSSYALGEGLIGADGSGQ